MLYEMTSMYGLVKMQALHPPFRRILAIVFVLAGGSGVCRHPKMLLKSTCVAVRASLSVVDMCMSYMSH